MASPYTLSSSSSSSSNGQLPFPFFISVIIHTLRFTPKPILSFSSNSPNSSRLHHCSASLPISTSQTQMEGSLLKSRAFWVSESITAWNVDGGDDSCYLFASKTAVLALTGDGISGEDVKVELRENRHGLPQNVKEKFPHIKDYRAFNVPSDLDGKSLLKAQLAVATFRSDGRCSDVTVFQLPGILDELFSYEGPLGAVFSEEAVSLYLWAPTSQTVFILIYKEPLGGDPLEVLQLEEVDGVWSTRGPKS